MASPSSYANITVTINTATTTFLIIIVIMHHMLYPVSCVSEHIPASSPRDLLLFEEKNRLGSVPPICHNKCNGCHPCMAVQVPSLLSDSYGRRFQPGQAPTATKEGFLFQDHNRYSNYKPMDWKCRCGDRFFDP